MITERPKSRSIIAFTIASLVLSAIIFTGCIGGIEGPETGGKERKNATSIEDMGGNNKMEGEVNEKITVNHRPRAVIWCSATTASIGTSILFDGSNSTDPDGTIVEYTWDFDLSDGIGMDATGPKVNHSYDTAGNYTVTLIVEDDDGATDTATITIRVTEWAEEGLKIIDIQCDEGNEGDIYVPLNPMAKGDKKHHWNMTAGAVKLKAILTWDDTQWYLEFSVGTGECPDKGETKALGSSNSGRITLEYMDPEGQYLEEGQWFAHIKVMNPEDHKPLIDKCHYEIKILVYVEEG